MKTKNFEGEGEGVPNTVPHSQIGNRAVEKSRSLASLVMTTRNCTVTKRKASASLRMTSENANAKSE